MCGIAGVLDFSGEAVDPALPAQACDALAHRGPDDRGTWLGGGGGLTAGLAAVRLAVQDPTPAGHQPMISADARHVLVFNGEVYNFKTLRRELVAAGWRFRTQCDTEVVLAACARWGPAALTRFNGMWALAYLDTQTGQGFLARDRFGIKPLVYCVQGRRCCFASEMRALAGLRPQPGQIDPSALLHYLRFGYIADPQTIHTDTYRLPPGYYLQFDRNGPGNPTRYYEVPVSVTNDHPLDYAGACRRVRSLTFSAVADRRVSDVPIGALLSGGLDSSIVVAHLASCSSRPVQTFSVGYAEHGTYDETAAAATVARRYGTDHHEIKLTYDDVLRTLLPIIDHLGEPFADSSILPTALVSQFARRHVTVALSGDGGDELFGGYWRYSAHDSAAAYRRLPAWLRRAIIEPVLARAPASKATRLRNLVRQFNKLLWAGTGDMWDRHLAWSQILSPDARAILTPTAVQLLADGDPVLRRMHATAPQADDPLNRLLAFDLQYSLPGDMLHKVDSASMFHSLEVRVPLLDYRLVDAVAPLPSSVKVHRGLRKRLLIDAHRDLLPDEILSAGKKGFEVPIGEFLRGPLAELYQDTVTRRAIDRFNLIDYNAAEQIYKDHRAQRADHAYLLYALLVLCRWASQNPSA